MEKKKVAFCSFCNHGASYHTKGNNTNFKKNGCSKCSCAKFTEKTDNFSTKRKFYKYVNTCRDCKKRFTSESYSQYILCDECKSKKYQRDER